MKNNLFDAYAMKARYVPAIITFFPSVLFISLICYKVGFSTDKIIGFTALSAALPLLFSEICRVQGKKLEAKNYNEWSGKPTTILLRRSDDHFSKVTKEKIYAFIYDDFGIDLKADNSDSNISEAVFLIIEYMRNKKNYELLQTHNVEYGFSRNLAGSNILFSIQSLLFFFITGAYYFLNGSYIAITEIATENVIVPVTFLMLFIISLILRFYYYPSMVKNNAFQYARTLLQSYYDLQN